MQVHRQTGEKVSVQGDQKCDLLHPGASHLIVPRPPQPAPSHTQEPPPQLAFSAPALFTPSWHPGLGLPPIRSPQESGTTARLEAEGILLWKLSF